MFLKLKHLKLFRNWKFEIGNLIFGDRLKVGQQVLVLFIGVRIPIPELRNQNTSCIHVGCFDFVILEGWDSNWLETN